DNYLDVPMKLPNSFGDFELTVTVDNRHLLMATKGYNNRLINQVVRVSKDKSDDAAFTTPKYVCLTATARISVAPSARVKSSSFREIWDNSESVTIARYLRCDNIKDGSWFKPPIGYFRIEEFLKGPPFGCDLPIRLEFERSGKSAPPYWKFPESMLPI